MLGTEEFLTNKAFFVLTVYGNLPSESQLADWEFAISQHSAVPQGILVRIFYHTVVLYLMRRQNKLSP